MFNSVIDDLGFTFAGDIHTDILIMGGGPAGIGAAAGAAKCSKKALLIDKNGFLGGMATLAAVSTLCGAYSADKQNQIIGGVYDELLTEMDALKGVKIGVDFGKHRADVCDHHLLKIAIDRLLFKHNVDFLLHTQAIGCKVNQSKIEYVIITNKEGIWRVFAEQYIDTTGDADIAAKCNVPYVIGDEKGQTQAATTIFKMGNVDLETTENITKQQFNDTIRTAMENKEYKLYRPSGVFMSSAVGDSTICNMNWISGFSPLNAKEMTLAEVEGRESSLEYSRFLKDKIPGFNDSYLSEIASQIGIRETRRINSPFTLTEEHVMQGATFEDAISWGAWPVEYHDAVNNRAIKTYLDHDYQIPYSTLLPQGISNLLVAGRPISTTHFANASTRVMAPCMATGHAAGVSASICINEKINPAEIDTKQLQRKLRSQNAFI